MSDRMEQIAHAFPETAWASNPKHKSRKANQKIIDSLTDEEFEEKFAELRGRQVTSTKIDDWQKPVRKAGISGAIAELTDEDYEAIFKAFPNLRCYAHEVRTMQAAHRKLKGIAPLGKADIQQLAQDFPDIYGPYAKNQGERMLVKGDDGTERWVDRQAWQHQQEIKRMLVLATREELAAGVAYARSVQAITAEPLPSDVTEWSNFTRGIVWAAMEKQGVFQ
jgi:hypothetical protein